MASELTFEMCVGKERYDLANKTNWYGFNHIPISKDTRCEYCAQHLKALYGKDFVYELVQNSGTIDCDTILDPVLCQQDSHGFKFKITSADCKRPYLVNPEKASERRNGLLVIEMPKSADYAICIDPPELQDNVYYSLDINVNNEKVVINDDKPTYCHSKVVIHGFKPDKKFSFVSNAEPTIIYVNIKIYKRTSSSNFEPIEAFTIQIQLMYVDPVKYQVPQHHQQLSKLREDTDNYYYFQEQQKLKDQARQLGLLTTPEEFQKRIDEEKKTPVANNSNPTADTTPDTTPATTPATTLNNAPDTTPATTLNNYV